MSAKVGQQAPDFTMPSTKNLQTLSETVSKSDYAGQWLVLVFYPLDFTFVCPTELTAIGDRIGEFTDRKASVIGVSTDSVHSHKAWLKLPRSENGVAGLSYPLASDNTHEVSRAYGVLKEDEGIAYRGLFIIGPDGTLEYSVVHNLNVGRSVDEVLRVLDGLQNGGLCPVNWHRGEATLNG
ncbi:MAG TPA: peroxiredoxin [Armatimonadota bacterium]|jgi:peroxiredoxin (alkyl hydroperoxide reductase subunit C)